LANRKQVSSEGRTAGRPEGDYTAQIELGWNYLIKYEELKERQKLWPFRLGEIGGRTYWYFQDCFYWEDDGLDADELYALLVSRQQRERGRIERAKPWWRWTWSHRTKRAAGT
jgi:hypothetical protein